MWPDRVGIAITAVIVVLLAGATVAVYSVDPIGDQATALEAVDGETVFRTAGCTGCHSLAGVANEGFIGPDLTGLPDRAADRVEGLTAEDYVRQSVIDPQAYIVDGYGEVMPTLPLDSAEVDALVEFLLSER